MVFTGAGPKAFSAGMNIEVFTGLDPARAKSFIGQLAAIMRAIRQAPVVTVAAVSGYCLGGAFELALACDLRVVTTTAAFGLPEIKVGVPSVIDAALLPGFVGLSKAREMILTGDVYRLDELPPDSITNVVAEPGGLAEATERLLARTATHTRTGTHRVAAAAVRAVAQPPARRGGGAEHGRVRRGCSVPRRRETRSSATTAGSRVTVPDGGPSSRGLAGYLVH